MRPDMYQVIIERPRLGGGRAKGDGRARMRDRLDPELAPTRGSMSRSRGTKHLNENLAPLRRFLRSRIGRPWDEVYAEICAHINLGSAVQKHVLDHLRDFVAEHVEIVDGVPHERRWGVLGYVGQSRSRLWVCPRTGLLRFAARAPRREPEPVARRVAVVSGDSEVWRIARDLFTVRFARLPPVEARSRCFDVVLATHLTPDWFDHRARLERLYGRDRYAASKRDPGRRELALADEAERLPRARS